MNRLFDHARHDIGVGTIDLATAVVGVALAPLSYVPNFSTDQFLAIAGGVVGGGIGSDLASVVYSAAGNFTSAPFDFGVVGGAYNAVLLFVDTGSSATSKLIAYIDTGTNIPGTPAGSDVVFAPDPVLGIFTL